MKILLVTYSFPPAAGVGVLRAFSLAKYLPGHGVQVEVLTTRNAAAVGQDASLLQQLSPEVRIHRTWTPDLPFALRKALKKALSRGGAGQSSTGLQDKQAERRFPSGMTTKGAKLGADIGSKNDAVAPPPAAPQPPLLKRLLANLLLPDPQLGWVPFAVRAAHRLLSKENGTNIDLVLVTVPPFSAARIITKLRRRYPTLPLVLDFRDEWLTTTLHLVSFNNNAGARAIAQRTEAEAVHAATTVVCVTEAAAAELRKRYPEFPADHFQCVPNGFDTPLPASIHEATKPQTTQPQDAPATLTYIGTVYGSTDPTPVVEAVLTLPAELRSRLHFRFIGHIETPAFRQTLQRLGEQVELIGFLPQAQALEYIAQTTYLLLITHDPINVAAKLYDYLGSGRPILAAVHPSGDVRRLLDQTHAGWSADIGSPAAIAQLLTEAIDRAASLSASFAPDREAIAQYHRDPLARRYAALLKNHLS